MGRRSNLFMNTFIAGLGISSAQAVFMLTGVPLLVFGVLEHNKGNTTMGIILMVLGVALTGGHGLGRVLNTVLNE